MSTEERGRDEHIPVLLREVIAALNINGEGVYVDCTFGRGGHAREILSRLGEKGRLLAMDRDPEAVAAAARLCDPRLAVVHAPFSRLEQIVSARGLTGKVNGVLFDLGVSSPQLEKADRGFSFLREGPLDMRMDNVSATTAAEWIARAGEAEIAQCLHTYGEERHARRIARAIVEARRQAPITTTRQLAGIVSRAHPSWERGQHPATRTFQAIRILINDELKELGNALGQALEVLAAGGRLLVVSFHSLEDRIVKQFMRREARGGDLPPDLPVPAVAFRARLRLLGKAIRARPEEVRGNPRARSAVLRVAEKLP